MMGSVQHAAPEDPDTLTLRIEDRSSLSALSVTSTDAIGQRAKPEPERSPAQRASTSPRVPMSAQV